MDENETSFWKKKPDELNVADNLKVVALVPVAMLVGFVAPAVVLSGVEKIRARFSKKPKIELTLVETTDEEVQ